MNPSSSSETLKTLDSLDLKEKQGLEKTTEKYTQCPLTK